VRLITFADDHGVTSVGVQLEDGVLPTGYADIRDLIEAGPPEMDRLREHAGHSGELVRPAAILAPVSSRAQLLYAGGNYADHLAETGLHPTQPVFFGKLRSAVIGPGQPIRISSPRTQADWEAELCIVFAKPAFRVPAERAFDYIFGYTMANDVSARDVMAAEPMQTTLCKCPDTFAPIGPHIITADDVPDVNTTALEISTRVNGVYKQKATTDTMIYSIPELVEFLTRTVTMQPGDIMSTGTCGGTGVGRHPQEFMHPGDEVTVGVSGVGYLTNPVVAGWAEEDPS
jgi:2-keto-4-pentenoate hydratase/2-oxohepta-3-ene-1,7-dioic acid hydratase in catechol pathway